MPTEINVQAIIDSYRTSDGWLTEITRDIINPIVNPELAVVAGIDAIIHENDGASSNLLNYVFNTYGNLSNNSGYSINAFAHIYASALIAHDYGVETAIVAGHLREIRPNNTIPSESFDQYNNHIGRLIGDYISENGLDFNEQTVGDLVAAFASENLLFNGTTDMTNNGFNFYDPNTSNVYSSIESFLKDTRGYTIQERCFIAGTLITMWDGSKKPIEDITPDDWVMSFDEAGKKVPGRVTRTFQNEAKIILNFHGVGVTPGHVYYCAGGTYEGKFATLIDIIRDDGVVQHEDGCKIRAATGFDVGSFEDIEIWAFITYDHEDGTQRVKDKKKLRLGTRFLRDDGMSLTIAGHLKMLGMCLRDDGYVEDESTGIRTLYQWCFTDTLPNPEDYILQLSKTSLEDIYKAGEWECVRPQMPPPLVMDGGPVQALSKNKLNTMPRNEPVIGKQGTKKKLH